MMSSIRRGRPDWNPPMPDILADIDALSAACKQGDIASVTSLLQKHPDVLALVIELLDMSANPVPFDVSGHYHPHADADWLSLVRERGHDAVADRIKAAIE